MSTPKSPASHAARIQTAIARCKARQTAAIAEASRLRDVVSRAVAHLPKRSLPAVWNQILELAGEGGLALCLLTLSEATGPIQARLGRIPDPPDVARMRALAEQRKGRRGIHRTTNATRRRPRAGA